MEFGDAYRAAMKARHLRDAHALVLIDPAEIVLRDVIGEGSFGRVWSATWQSSEVAVKEFVLAQAAFAGGSLQRRDIVEAIVGEAGIMAYLRHPKVLQLYGCALTAQAIWIVSELCAHGSLRQVLDDDKVELSVETRLRMAIDVAEGMLFLHTRERPIVHRDLKSHNLFVADVRGRLRVRIGDWGSARPRGTRMKVARASPSLRLPAGAGADRDESLVLARTAGRIPRRSARAVAATPEGFARSMTHGVGTTCWLAPELIKDNTGTETIDVYAFGIVLWELATREEVYHNLSAAQIISRVANEGLRPPLPAECPWRDVMAACWAEDPLSAVSAVSPPRDAPTIAGRRPSVATTASISAAKCFWS